LLFFTSEFIGAPVGFGPTTKLVHCITGRVRSKFWVDQEVRKRNFGRGGASMKRRDFLRSAGVVSASVAFPQAGRLFAQETSPKAWRTFEVTINVQVLKPSGTTRIWIPAALVNPTPFQKTLANDFKAEGGTAKLIENSADSLGSSQRNFLEA
jgi:hypothetical protein